MIFLDRFPFVVKRQHELNCELSNYDFDLLITLMLLLLQRKQTIDLADFTAGISPFFKVLTQ